MTSCNYTKKKLLKALNETYFRDLQHLDSLKGLYPIKEFDINKLIHLAEALLHLNKIGYFPFDIESTHHFKFLTDLININSPIHFKTSIAKTAQNILTQCDKQLQQALDINCQYNPVLREVKEILANLSKNSCLVGGAVRDILTRNKKPKDFDFVTDVNYDILSNAFLKAGFTIQETGKQFLVLNVVKNKEQFEIACFRADGTYSDGRRPESVSIGTIFDDAQRRDFTINAGYFNLFSENYVDPTGDATDDIIEKNLRFVGNAFRRIEEDNLRVFRFYRFVQRGFKPVEKDLRMVRNTFDFCVKNTSSMRIMNEIEKMAGL